MRLRTHEARQVIHQMKQYETADHQCCADAVRWAQPLRQRRSTARAFARVPDCHPYDDCDP
jgi:hypothetical protein